MPRPVKKKEVELYDMNLARRLYSFRYEFVSKLQKEAAELLGVSAPYLSSAELGKRPINYNVVDTLATKFNMNREWFSTGNGNQRVSGPEKPTAASSLVQVHTDVLSIMKSIKILEANLTQAFKIIEQQQKRIDELESKIKQKRTPY